MSNDHFGYVLKNIGIGKGDYLEFRYCLNCVQILDENWPAPPIKVLGGYEVYK